MKAIASNTYGPLEQLKQIDISNPSPRNNEVCVRVHASSLNPADYKVILGTVKFLHARNFPMVLGYDYSGVIESVGASVSSYKNGDEVFGFLPYGPGNRQGTFAEIITAKLGEFAIKPKSVSHEQAAAAATSGITAIQSFKKLGNIKPNDRVLITGASGGVGSIAIGIAKKLGATVTAVGSGSGLELARKLGANSTIDRKTESVLSQKRGPFDIVFDAAAAYRWKQWNSMIAPGGTYITTLPSLYFAADKLASLFSKTRAAVVMVKSRESDLKLLGEWLTTGLGVPLDTTVLVRDVASSLARLQKGNINGKIAVRVHNGF